MAKPRLIREIVEGPVIDLAQEDTRLAAFGKFVYFRASSAAAGSELWRSDGTPAGTTLLKDLRPGRQGSFPRVLRSAGSNLFFSARGETGREFYKTDGTATGTVMVKEIMPGLLGSMPNSPVAVGTTLFFAASDGNPSGESSLGEKLWKSNGSADGTVAVVFDGNRSLLMGSPVEVNNNLFFVSNDGQSGQELWKTEIDAKTASLVRDLRSGGGSFPTYLTRLGSQIYFFADNGESGRELWRSDGTVDGTLLVKDINPGAKGSNPKFMIAVGTTLYFAVDDGTNGYELWKSEGTNATTVLVRDINAGTGSSSPGIGSSGVVAAAENLLYFTANDGLTGTELWKSDGTLAGTVRVKDIRVGPDSADPEELTVVNNKLYFTADDGNSGRELWRSDGTEAGTVLVQDLRPGAIGSYVESLVQVENNLFFKATSADKGQELWALDVTPLPQVSVAVFPGVVSEDGKEALVYTFQRTGPTTAPLTIRLSVSGTASAQKTATGQADYTGLPNGATKTITIPVGATRTTLALAPIADSSFEPDETVTIKIEDSPNYESVAAAVTGVIRNDEALRMVRDIKNGPGSSNASYLTMFNNTLYFSADDGESGIELWKSDGTNAGTTLITDLNAKGNSSTPNNLTALGSVLLFSADNGEKGRELFKTNGTAAGTTLLNDIRSGQASSNPKDLTVFGKSVLFAASDGTYGEELFKTDGVGESGVSRVRDINTRFDSSPGSFAVIGEQHAIFVAASPDREIWRTDGTSGGTLLLRDIFAGDTSSNPQDLTTVGSKVFFKADHATYGEELWSTDGTAAGTRIVRDIAPGKSGSLPSGLTAFGNKLIFKAVADAGYEIWSSDGTDTGTQQLLDINPGPQGSDPTEFTAVGTTLFFTATDGQSGLELWKTDGTAKGTMRVRDIVEGPGSSRPRQLTALGDRLFFVADDGKSGAELWTSDGTAKGTVMVGDINRGSGSSDPLNLTAAVNRLYFTAVDDVNCGRELWSYDLPPQARSVDLVPLKSDQPEGNQGAVAFTYDIRRTGDLSKTASVTWAVAPGSGSSQVDKDDFMSGVFPTGSATFAPGVSTVTISVPVRGDALKEADERFIVTLSNPKETTIRTGQVEGIIRSDELVPGSLSMTALSAALPEGRSGMTSHRYMVNRSGSTLLPATYRWRVVAGASSPVNADDFVSGLPNGELVFSAGQATQEITVRVKGDQASESDESFTVELLDPANVVAASVISKVLNDDVIGTPQADALIGSPLADYIEPGRGRDVITGDLGADLIAIQDGDSLVDAADLVIDFSFGVDKFLYLSPAGISDQRIASLHRSADNASAATVEGLAKTVFADANGAAAGSQPLSAMSAALVVAQNPAIRGTYLFINNADRAFNPASDTAIRLNGIQASELPALGVINATALFA